MSNEGLAKVSRRRFNLDSVIYSYQQEVTVPASIRIPADTQYLLQPVLVLSRDKIVLLQGPGKVRIQGQIEGFISCVDSDEGVHTIALPVTEFMTAFSVTVPGNSRLDTEVTIEGIEVDRGEDNVANVTVFISAGLLVLQREETDLVTAVSGNVLAADSNSVKLHHIIGEIQSEKNVIIPVSDGQDIKPIATDLGIGNLSWQVVEGKLTAAGIAMGKVYGILGESGKPAVLEGSEDFELELDYGHDDINDSSLQCIPVKVTHIPGSGLEVSLQIKATGYREINTEYITSLAGADSLIKKLHLRNRVGESEYKLNMEGFCQFPAEPESVDFILPRVRVVEAKALEGKVLVRGLLSLNLYYTDGNGLSRVVVQEEEFNQFLELAGCDNGFSVKAWAWPEHAELRDERYRLSIMLRIEVVEDVEISTVTDVHVVDSSVVPSSSSVVLYLTKKEDSLFSVARKFNVTLDALREYNGLPAAEGIRSGQKLMIPVYQQKYKK